MHEGRRFPCDACDYCLTQNGDLKKQYPCYVCDFLATEKGHLRHQQSVHEV